MNPEFNTPPEFDRQFDRILEIDDTFEDQTEIRLILRERTPRLTFDQVPA